MENTTIAISKEIYKRLQAVKHKLEKENDCNYSFGGTVQYLLEREEGICVKVKVQKEEENGTTT